MRMKWDPWTGSPNDALAATTMGKIEISEFDRVVAILLESNRPKGRELAMTVTDDYSRRIHAQIWRGPDATASREAFQNLAEEIIMVYLRRRRDSFSRVIAEMGG